MTQDSAQSRVGYEKCFNCWTEITDDSNPNEPDHFVHLVTLKEACHPDDLRAASMDTDPTIGYVATPTPPADDEGYSALTFSGVFDGIGGFTKGFTDLGWTPLCHVEKDKHRQKVLEAHYPGLLRGDDVRDATGADVGRPDVFAAGFPCQGVSHAAPNRHGLRDVRSNLYWEYHRLLGEVQRLIDSARPTWAVIENTPGLLVSGPKHDRGADMEAVLRSLVDLGYGVAYRVVDANRVGSAQRRQRLLIVGHLGGDPRVAWSVLGDAGDGGVDLGGHDPSGRSRAQRSTLVGGAGGDGDEPLIWRKSRNPRGDWDYSTWLPATYANTLAKSEGGMGHVVRQRHLILQNGRLRVPHPREWERWQGFPTDWTAMIPDAARFQALGDALNVDMGRWLGRRIQAVHTSLPLVGVR